MNIGRRAFLMAAGSAAAGSFHEARAQSEPLIRRAIPSSGALIPAIGLGTANGYETTPAGPQFAVLRETIRAFTAGGGTVIDTASTYGEAERIIGRIAEELQLRNALFLATKVDASGQAEGVRQIEESFRDLRTAHIDLIAVHNLEDTATQLRTLRDLKQSGRIRYVGVTTSFAGQHAQLAELMARDPLDFVQVDFAIDNRDAAMRILPLAGERGIAVMINLPLGRGRLFRAVRGKALPDWAAEFDCRSWAQFFLKYVISFDAVTCAIPGMSKPEHAVDNMAAARGRLPDADMRQRMERWLSDI